MYPTGHSNLAKVMPVSLLVLHDVPDPLCDVPVPLLVPHILPGPLKEVLMLLCIPNDVPEHLKDVHIQFLDLTKTGKNIHFGSFFDDLMIKKKKKKKVYPHKTPILPLSFAT
jgi:hypothetical protein